VQYRKLVRVRAAGIRHLARVVVPYCIGWMQEDISLLVVTVVTVVTRSAETLVWSDFDRVTTR